MSTTQRHAGTAHAAPLAALSLLVVVSASAATLVQQPPQTIASVANLTDACLTQTMAVVGDVHRVFGPRLFTVAVPGIYSDQLVFVPGPRVAAVANGFPVCVFGTITRTRDVNFEDEWGSFFDDTHAIVDAYPTMLTTNQVASGGMDLVMAAAAHATWPDTADAGDRTVTDADRLATSTDTRLVGQFVSLRGVRIATVVSPAGFWIATDHEELFVLPSDEIHPKAGQRVNLKGIVLQLPDGMINRLGDYPAARDEAIYVYASQFRAL
jgi:hypothetical protein